MTRCPRGRIPTTPAARASSGRTALCCAARWKPKVLRCTNLNGGTSIIATGTRTPCRMSASPTFTSRMVIRKAERRDLEALGTLGAMLIRTHYAFDQQRFLKPVERAESGYASFLGSVLDNPDACIFVAEEDSTIIGYVFAALEPLSWKELRGPAGFIHDLAVIAERRCEGVGTKLIETAIDWFREHGAPRVVLGTAAANETAHTLFRRLGFRDTMVEMTMELDRR